jgi:hypothetical protein
MSDSAILHEPSTCLPDGKSAKKVMRELRLEPADLKGGKFLTISKVLALMPCLDTADAAALAEDLP